MDWMGFVKLKMHRVKYIAIILNLSILSQSNGWAYPIFLSIRNLLSIVMPIGYPREKISCRIDLLEQATDANQVKSIGSTKNLTS